MTFLPILVALPSFVSIADKDTRSIAHIIIILFFFTNHLTFLDDIDKLGCVDRRITSDHTNGVVNDI